MIYTSEQIEWEVSQCSGTWVKRRNLREKLTQRSNEIVKQRIDNLRKDVRRLRVAGASEQQLAPIYGEITQLEIRLIG